VYPGHQAEEVQQAAYYPSSKQRRLVKHSKDLAAKLRKHYRLVVNFA